MPSCFEDLNNNKYVYSESLGINVWAFARLESYMKAIGP